MSFLAAFFRSDLSRASSPMQPYNHGSIRHNKLAQQPGGRRYSTADLCSRVVRSAHHKGSEAFTFVELSALVLMLVLLAIVLAPALARTKPVGQSVQCVHNLKQLAVAEQMYGEDNADQLIIKMHGAAARGGFGISWVQGWLDWTRLSDNTNYAFLVNPRYAKIAPYVNRTATLFQCPADRYVSYEQRYMGWTRRVRNYSANIAMGYGNAENGAWSSIYKHVIKFSELGYPSPADSFIHLDEHPDSINDAAWFPPRQNYWIDLPSGLHNGGACGFSYADGHADVHRWIGYCATGVVRQVLYTWPYLPNMPGDPDLHWVSYHTQRQTTNSY